MKRLSIIITVFLALPLLFHYNYLLDKAAYYFSKPRLREVKLKPFPAPREKVILVPLDSRPPCLSFVESLAEIANLELLSPPKDILDNYNIPAPIDQVNTWLLENSPEVQAAILSTDMLLHGGLIASREPKQNKELQKLVFANLQKLSRQDKLPLYAFSIIPRLLIAEDDQTKLWQYHVMVYATKKDMENTLQNPADFHRMQEMLAVVPPGLITGFNDLYKENDAFNYALCDLARQSNFKGLIFGQDDGQPFGRPNESKLKLEKYLGQQTGNSRITTAYGADELAMLQLAFHFNTSKNYTPQIAVLYTGEETPDLLMPFMPTTLSQTAQEKITQIGGQLTKDLTAADLVLFVHAGTHQTTAADLAETAQKISLLTKSKPVALVDLSYNFLARETVLGSLLENNFPLSSLTSYAGWNTASNSLGTALAQASIFLNQKQNLPAEYQPYLHQKNSEFTVRRVLDDWAYQKDVQKITNKNLHWKNINPYKLAGQKNFTQQKIAASLKRRAESLFYKNIALHPFYSDEEQAYYFTDFELQVLLPWERTFEVELRPFFKVGCQRQY